MSHWGSWIREGHSEISFSGRWIWQWCVRSTQKPINKKGETSPSQEYYKFPFGQHYTVIKPWGRLISVEGCRTVTLTAAHCGKDEMNAASQRPDHEAGNLSSLYVSEADVRRQNVSKIFESIHSFIHLASICSDLLCAGCHDSLWRYEVKQYTFYLLKNLFLIAVDSPPQIIGRFRNPEFTA